MSKQFGALKALDDVSIKVPAGTFHALLGENGAGKSTLVKCVMGFYVARQGPSCCSTARTSTGRAIRATRRRWASAWFTSILRWCRR